MTQEDKELLLQDLCARLSYGVRVAKGNIIYPLTGINIALGYVELAVSERISIEDVRPYLHPLSSMTDEEKEELSDYLCERVMSDKRGITFPPDPIHGKGIPFEWMSSCIDLLNKKMFDYRGLIPMGLALPATEDMYK